MGDLLNAEMFFIWVYQICGISKFLDIKSIVYLTEKKTRLWCIYMPCIQLSFWLASKNNLSWSLSLHHHSFQRKDCFDASCWFDNYPVIAGIILSTSRLCFPHYHTNDVNFTDLLINCIDIEMHKYAPHQIHESPYDQWSFPLLLWLHTPTKQSYGELNETERNGFSKQEPESSYWF